MVYLFIIKRDGSGGVEILHRIPWKINEDFTRLIKHKPFKLCKTSATDIARMSGLSIQDRMLLNGAVGMTIPYLLGCDYRDFDILELAFEKDP